MSNKSIVLVDDDQFCHLMTRMVLHEYDANLDIEEFYHGLHALTFLRHLDSQSAWPDVIVTDLEMPIMNGVEFLRALAPLRHRQTKPTRVVVLTACQDNQIVERAAELGVDAFLTKPIDLEDCCQIYPGAAA